jgi:hypothetical protein
MPPQTAFHQLVLGDNLARVEQQLTQDFQGLPLQIDEFSSNAQPAKGQVCPDGR